MSNETPTPEVKKVPAKKTVKKQPDAEQPLIDESDKYSDTEPEVIIQSDGEGDVEEITISNKIELHLPYKKCIGCGHLFEYEDDLDRDCSSLATCPAVKFVIKKGVDPKILIDTYTDLLFKANINNDTEEFTRITDEITKRGKQHLQTILMNVIADTTEFYIQQEAERKVNTVQL